ncbi:MAG: hypothetical protein ACUVYA_16510 [Planctomycetota bacterium]
MRVDKGTLSNCASAAALLAGLSLPRGPVQGFVLAVGLFAFGGGITNSLAVKMLFDRIPFLIGSGVIPARFREIRTKIRQLIMTHFFAPRNLEEYFREHRTDFDPRRYLKGAEGRGLVSAFLEANWEKIASPQVIEPIVDRQIQKLLDSPMGGVLIMVGVDNVKPTVTQFVAGLVAQMRTRVLDMAAGVGPDLTVEIDERKLSEDLCAHVENLLESKLRELDAQRVKRLLEEVIRRHLGWLVVWGNVCGGILGLLSRLAGWAP